MRKLESSIPFIGKYGLEEMFETMTKLNASVKLNGSAYTIFQIQAKMARDKCHIFDWWMKRKAFIVV